jgi:putative nucleotidyltransferase-like protein
MTIESHAGEGAPAAHHYSSSGLRAAGDALAPEFLLAAACCRWPASEARDAAVRSAAAGVTDWNHFLRLIGRQRVSGLVHDALLAAGIDLPSAVAKVLAARAGRIARRNSILAAETVRLQRALESANIPVLVLKGVALAQLAYGSLGAKHARDIDLLVPPQRAEAAMRLLEREGYVLSSPAKQLSDRQRRSVVRYAREVELVHSDSRLIVELQWRVMDNPLLLRDVDAHSAAQSVTLSDGATVQTLGQEDLFAYLCVHGAHHAWSRLKWLADVNALVANGADVGHLYCHAQRIGAGLCAGQGLLLCRWLFALNLPEALVDELRANQRVRKLMAIALDAMTAPRAETEADGGIAGVTRVVRTQFLLGQGWAFYAAQIRVAAAGPADVIRFPLPMPLHFLYPLLRLPLWLWRRSTSARGR